MARHRRTWSAVIAVSLVAGLATAAAPPAGADPPVTVVVSYEDLSPNGPWALEEDSDTGTFSFTEGPATPPGGTGSLAMAIASGQHEWMNNYAYGLCATTPSCDNPATQTPIADFDALELSIYRDTGSTMPSLNIETYINGSSLYTTLAFVPAGGQVIDDTWQSWDGMSPADGVWYSSRNVGSGVFNCAGFSCSASWAQVVASYPNAEVAFGLGPNVGTGGTFSGNIDNLTIGVDGATNVYDFERVECTTTCYVDPVNGDDSNTGTVSFPVQTIQAGVDLVSPGGTVQLAAGTYAENVVVDKAATVSGAGPSSVVVPGTSNPDCGGAGGGSLCPGASSVFLIESDDVRIQQLTVDGDNPGLTGVAVGGADVDARNGIITNHAAGTFDNLQVHEATVRNIYLRGIYASSGGTFAFANNDIDNVQGEAASIGIFNFGGSGSISGNDVQNTNDGIAANHSRGTTMTGNEVTSSGSGLHTDNAGDSGGTSDVISGNTVSSCTADGYGVWTFVAYLPVTVSDNDVSGCDTALAGFASCNLAGVNNCPGGMVPTVTFTGNTVVGEPGGVALMVSTTSFGFGDGNVKVSADHNVLSGAAEGVYVEETGTATAMVVAYRNDVSGNSLRAFTNTGSSPVNGICNWWGQASGWTAGQSSGVVIRSPYLLNTNLDSNCIPIMKIGQGVRQVEEGNSGTTPVTLTVTLDRRNYRAVTVQWYTQDGTAVAGTDYVAASGTLSIPAGQTSGTITVQMLGDTVPENHERFTVQLHSATDVILANGTKRIDILNDDKPTVSVNNVTVTEGNQAVITATLSHQYSHTVTLTVTSINGTATAPGDYTAVSSGTTLNFAPGTTVRTISIPIIADGVAEPNQTFTVRFTGPNVTNSPQYSTITIQEP